MSDYSYRWADHHVVESADGTAVLFGADEASVFALDGSARQVLDRWRGHEAIDLGEAPPHEREVLEALRDAWMLVPSGSRRDARPPLDPAAVPLGTLVLEVAQACNLRCSYCYAGGGSYGAPSRLMPAALARRAARFLVEASGSREHVTLVLFGGEPLLNLPAIEAAVLEAEAAAAAAGKSLSVSLTTNGTRFTPKALAFLRAHRVGLTVSIDGPPDIHDANRRHAASQDGSYADVIAGLAMLREHGLPPPAARVTLEPDQWPRIAEVFEHVLGLGFREVGIAPVSPVSAAMISTAEQDAALIAGFDELAQRFRRNALHGRVLPFSNLVDLLARIHAGHAKTAPCGAGLGYLALDAEGRLYLCHRLAGSDAFLAGSLDDGIDHARIAACLAAQAAPRREDCARCWARALCAGGCHHDNHVREAKLGQAPGGSCAFVRRWLELGIGLYADLRATPNDAVMAALAARAA